MKKQYGKISGAMIGLISVVAIMVVLVGTVAVSYISAANYGVRAENQIKAQYTNMENILGQYSLKVSEAAQVPGMYKDDLKEVMTSVMTARQGGGGSKAAFQWFKEHQINIDPSMYTKIQQIIEAGRNKFENTQTKFIDTKRTYENNLGYVWKGMWMKFAGYPKINLADYKIISSGHAKTTFKTGIDTGMKLR